MTPAVYQWAARHGVSLQAVQELAKYGIDGTVDAAAYFSTQG